MTEDLLDVPGEPQPDGALTIRTLAMPADTNTVGDIFRGWVLSQMDIAGSICADTSGNSSFCRPLLMSSERVS